MDNLHIPTQKQIVIVKAKGKFLVKQKQKRVMKQLKKKEQIADRMEKEQKNQIPQMTRYEKVYRGATNQLDYNYMAFQRTIEKIQSNNTKKQKRIQGNAKILDEDMEKLTPQTEDMFVTEEILQIRQNLDDMNYGEYVMLMPNPDHESVKNKAFTLNQAMTMFDAMQVTQGMNKQQQIDERQAFIKAYLNMPDYLGGKPQKDLQDKLKTMFEDGIDTTKLTVQQIEHLSNIKEDEDLEEELYQIKRQWKSEEIRMKTMANKERIYKYANRKEEYEALQMDIQKKQKGAQIKKQKLAIKMLQDRIKTEDNPIDLEDLQNKLEDLKIDMDIIMKTDKVVVLKNKKLKPIARPKFTNLVSKSVDGKKLKYVTQSKMTFKSTLINLKRQSLFRMDPSLMAKAMEMNTRNSQQLGETQSLKQGSGLKTQEQKKTEIKVDDEENKDLINKIQKQMDNAADDKGIVIKNLDMAAVAGMEDNQEQKEEVKEEQKAEEEKVQSQDVSLAQIENENEAPLDNDEDTASQKMKKKMEEQAEKLRQLKEFQQMQYDQLVTREIKDKLYHQEYIKNLKDYNRIQKNYSQGGYVYNKYNPDTEETHLINRGDEQPKDFLTLFRFTIMFKLSSQGNMLVRNFLTSDHKFVVVVLKSSEEMCLKQACLMKMSKQIELGAIDIMSLEPVDKDMRPLRFKSYVNDRELVGKNEMPAADPPDVHSVDTKGQELYQNAMNLDEDDFQEELIKRKNKFDLWLTYMNRQLGTNISMETSEIIQEAPTSRQEWTTFYIYMEYVNDFMTKYAFNYRTYLDEVAEKKPIDQQQHRIFLKNKFFVLRLIFMKALAGANNIQEMFKPYCCGSMTPLTNIWNMLGYSSPVSPYEQFFSDSDPNSQFIWRTFETNEIGQRNIFNPMEKLKMANATIIQVVNIDKLVKTPILLQYFPLHDSFLLNGVKKALLLRPMQLMGILNPLRQSRGAHKMFCFFKTLSATADPSDFDTNGSYLEKELAISICSPMTLSIEAIKNYFGEKTGMYFFFLISYTRGLKWMAVFSLLIYILVNVLKAELPALVLFGCLATYSTIIGYWNSNFLNSWKQNEMAFAMEYGQENFYKEDATRSSFFGKFIRSPENDDMNDLYYSEKVRNRTTAINYTISFLIILAALAAVFFINVLKHHLTSTQFAGNNQMLIQNIPAFATAFQIALFNGIYMKVAFAGTAAENHKKQQANENSLIFKIFSFMLVNQFQSFMIVAFLSSQFQSLNLCKIVTVTIDPITLIQTSTSKDDCFGTLQIQINAIFIAALTGIPGGHIGKLVKSRIKGILNKPAKVEPVLHGFFSIDKSIEKQLFLIPYKTNPKFKEIDYTMGSYVILVNQFAFLVLFGTTLPIIFIFSFISNICSIYTDKTQIISCYQRPVPGGASNIGSFYMIMQLISCIGVLTNAGILAYTYKPSAVLFNQHNAFTYMFLINLIIKFIANYAGDENGLSTKIKQRHKFLRRSLKKKNLTPFKKDTPILNIQGIMQEEAKLTKDGESSENVVKYLETNECST